MTIITVQRIVAVLIATIAQYKNTLSQTCWLKTKRSMDKRNKIEYCIGLQKNISQRIRTRFISKINRTDINSKTHYLSVPKTKESLKSLSKVETADFPCSGLNERAKDLSWTN